MTLKNSVASFPKIERRVKLIPPDGGWGWMVLFGTALTNTFNQSMFSQFGLLYGDLLEEMGHKTTGAAVIMSTMLCVTNCGGPFAGALVKVQSPRFVCVTGSIVCATGIFLSAFSTNIIHLILSYGVLFGLGLGFIQNAAFVSINSYFKLRKSIAVGIAMTGTGVGQALMPHVVRYLLDAYGFRGACLLLSAMCLHGVCGTLLLQPVEWHMKKVEEEVIVEEGKLLSNESERKECDNKGTERKRSVFRKVLDLFDMSLLSNPRFTNVIIGIALTYISVQNFGMLYPFFLQNYVGMSKQETANCMSAVAFADIIGRLVVPPVQAKFNVSARMTLVLTCIWIAITRQILAYQTDMYVLLLLSALYGIGRSMVIVVRNITITEHCGADQVANAVGLGMLSLGLITPPIGYFLGWIRDYTDDYIACLTAQNGLLVLFLFMWIPDMFYARYKKAAREERVDEIQMT
ncbi:unnamed protein product [Leptosia nina]|uniref:Monocarboxylate transporter n=1 Tax=Leptosia nina TaxID=320188 RepID=A0AAV1J9I2_9NEOP